MSGSGRSLFCDGQGSVDEDEGAAVGKQAPGGHIDGIGAGRGFGGCGGGEPGLAERCVPLCVAIDEAGEGAGDLGRRRKFRSERIRRRSGVKIAVRWWGFGLTGVAG